MAQLFDKKHNFCYNRIILPSYVGTSVIDYNRLGAVYQIDTATCKVVKTVNVGYQPDELAIRNGKIYVANSGGYKGNMGRGYDNTVSGGRHRLQTRHERREKCGHHQLCSR